MGSVLVYLHVLGREGRPYNKCSSGKPHQRLMHHRTTLQAAAEAGVQLCMCLPEPGNVVAVTLATSQYKIQRIGLEDTLVKGVFSSPDFSCPIRYQP